MKRKARKHKKIWLILAIILFVIACVTGGIFIRNEIVKAKAQKEREELQQQVNTLPVEVPEPEPEPEVVEEPEPEPEPEPKEWDEMTMEEKCQAYEERLGIKVPVKNLDFDELLADVNAEIFAWMTVPGTNIDDPLVQHDGYDGFYLNHNLDMNRGLPGAYFIESCNHTDLEDRMTVVYGHNMANGTAFAELHWFEEKKFFEENRYIFVYTPETVYVYEIFAAYEASASHIIKGHSWNDNTWVQYLSDTLKMNNYADNHLENYEFYADDKVLTLSTCARNKPNNRYLVQGVRLDEPR